MNQAYQQEGGQYSSQGIPTGAGISTQICYYCHDYGDYGDYYPPQALPTKAVQTRPQPIRCLGHNFSCLGAPQAQTATNLLTCFTHTALPFVYHKVLLPAWHGLQVAYHRVLAYRGTLFTIGAIGLCLFASAGACAPALFVALGILVQQRAAEFGFKRSIPENTADVLSTFWMGIPMTAMSALKQAVPWIARLAAISPDAEQLVGGFLPGHDRVFSTAIHWDQTDAAASPPASRREPGAVGL